MSLNKKKMVREIGRRTRIKNRDVQAVIEALIEMWTEELVGGGRIELENFLVLKTHRIEITDQPKTASHSNSKSTSSRRVQLMIHASKTLKRNLEMRTE